MSALFEPKLLAGVFDRFETYARARREQPLSQDAQSQVWNVLTHAGCSKALLDHRTFSSDRRNGAAASAFNYTKYFQPSMIRLDPPEHSRLRDRLKGAFGPRVLGRLEPMIRRYVNDALDRALAAGGFELMSELAYPLPQALICDMLGIPEADRPNVKQLASGVITSQRLGTFSKMTPEDAERVRSSAAALNEYFFGLVKTVRARGRDETLISELVHDHPDDPLSDPELGAMLVLLVTAGHTTTAKLVGNLAVMLTRFPEVKQRLTESPALIPQAVQEVLRFYAPVQAIIRYTTSATELEGVQIPERATVALWLGSANRDPAAHADGDGFDLQRGGKHLAFGLSTHYCSGAPLANLEARIFTELLLERAPQVRRADDTPIASPSDPAWLGPERLMLAVSAP